jgi:crossover junction endodeoxyribonuclease RuvC
MIIGIDPGLNGAIAFYAQDIDYLHIVDMPVVESVRNKKNRRVIDCAALTKKLAPFGGAEAWVEHVTASPQMGVVSAFNFGMGFGMLRGCLAALGIRFFPVVPAVWKPSLNVPADKKAARLRASELLPNHSHLWPLDKHDGRAEAALIALYGSRQK